MENTVTIEKIENIILKEDYIKVGLKTVIAVLTLKNSFEIIGTSACVDLNNFDFEIGKKYAREKAIDQIWMLEGYLLQSK
jgi:hypothetical protein